MLENVGKFLNCVLIPTEIKEIIYLAARSQGTGSCQFLCHDQLTEKQILILICKTLDKLQLYST